MSDQPIRKKTKDEIHVHPHTKRFARYFEYIPNDLLFNRQGYLSPRQTQELRNSLTGALGGYLVFIMGLAILIAYDLSIPKKSYGISVLAGMAMAVLFIWMIRDIIKHRQAIRHGRVVPLVGPAHRRSYEYQSRFTYTKHVDYYVKFGSKEFQVMDGLYKLCQQNLVYCAYVSNATGKIIAIEVVDDSIHDMPEWMRRAYETISVEDFKAAGNQKSLLLTLID